MKRKEVKKVKWRKVCKEEEKEEGTHLKRTDF